MNETVNFREEDHTYHVGGHRVPSVTELLKPVTRYGDGDNIEAMRLGSDVHEATALDDYNDLDEESVPSHVWPYVHAWRVFLATREYVVQEIERTVYNPALRYAGTLDRVLVKDGKAYLADIKTGSDAPWHALQLYAYREAYDPVRVLNTEPKGLVVFLSGNLTFDFRLVDLSDAKHKANLVALRRVWDIKKEFGAL